VTIPILPLHPVLLHESAPVPHLESVLLPGKLLSKRDYNVKRRNGNRYNKTELLYPPTLSVPIIMPSQREAETGESPNQRFRVYVL